MALSTYTAWGHETSFYRFCQIVPEVGMTKIHPVHFTPCGINFLMFLNEKTSRARWVKTHNFYWGGESESQIMFYTLHHLANECQPWGKYNSIRTGVSPI